LCSYYVETVNKKIEDRVCEIFSVDREDLFSKSRKKVEAGARGLFCFWAVTELGCGQKELAKKLGMTQPGVGYAVIKGKPISKSNHLELKKMS